MKKINFKDRIFGTGKKGKKTKKSEGGKKVISGMLFAAACFIAIFVLLEFHDIYWVVGIACALLMGAAFWFLDSMFSGKEDIFDELTRAQEELDRVREEDRKKADDAFKKKIEEQVSSLDRTSRAMFAAMKKSADAQENHLSKMQFKIDKVIIEQSAGVKTMIKFNKENARQMALSEKATLEELATRMPAGRRNVVMAPEVPEDYVPDDSLFEDDNDETEEFVYEANDDNNLEDTPIGFDLPEENEAESGDISLDSLESLLPKDVIDESAIDAIMENNMTAGTKEEENVSDEIAIEEAVSSEETSEGSEEEIIETPIEIAGITEETEEPAIEEPVIEEPVIEEPTIEEPAIEEPVTEEPIIEEPTIDEITETPIEIPEEIVDEEPVQQEPVIEEPVIEETVAKDPLEELIKNVSEDSEEESEKPAKDTSEAALASATGVDLSNPNANLSADDIAKLFEAAKNS